MSVRCDRVRDRVEDYLEDASSGGRGRATSGLTFGPATSAGIVVVSREPSLLFTRVSRDEMSAEDVARVRLGRPHRDRPSRSGAQARPVAIGRTPPPLRHRVRGRCRGDDPSSSGYGPASERTALTAVTPPVESSRSGLRARGPRLEPDVPCGRHDLRLEPRRRRRRAAGGLDRGPFARHLEVVLANRLPALRREPKVDQRTAPHRGGQGFYSRENEVFHRGPRGLFAPRAGALRGGRSGA